MGSVISTAANGIGSVIGNVIAAPFKNVFGGSCEGVCSGTWDVACFVENLCLSKLVKLLMVSGLCYITLLFLYLLFKVGIIQCVAKSLCKICWAACETYWCTLADIFFFLWHKITNVKRVNRRHRRRDRFKDIELGQSSTDEIDFSDNSQKISRKRKFVRRNHLTRYHRHRHHHLRSGRGAPSLRVNGNGRSFKSSRSDRGALSLRVKGGSRVFKSSRQRRVRNPPRKAVKFKRRKVR